MNLILERRLKEYDDLSTEEAKEEYRRKDKSDNSFVFKSIKLDDENRDGGMQWDAELQYCPCSIIEVSMDNDKVANKMMIYHPSDRESDRKLDDHQNSLITKLSSQDSFGPKMLV